VNAREQAVQRARGRRNAAEPGKIQIVTRAAKFVLVLLVLAGAGLALRPWIEQELMSRARAAYFAQGRAHAPRVLEELGPLPPELREDSGLAVSRTQPGVLWAHNDSGDAPTLYAIDMKGAILAKVAVVDAVAVDWEDIAGGPCPEDGATTHCLYIADTGNNNRSRDIVNIFVVAEPSISGADPARPLSTMARTLRFRYPTETEDTEAIAVLPNGDVTIVTKGRTPKISFFGFSKADIARALMSGEVLTAVYQGDTGISPEQGLGRWVTSAAMSPDGKTLAVRTYSEIFFYAPERSSQGYRWRDLQKPCFLGEIEPQGEALDYLDDRTLIIGSETAQGRQGIMHRVQC
jgi:hypothetical protein